MASGINGKTSRAAVVVAAAALVVAACGGPDPDGTAQAEDQTVTWSDSGGFSVPSAEAGPTDTEGQAPGGFEQSGFGAALAAAHYSVALDTAGDSDFGAVLNEVTVDDDGRKQWAAARAGLKLGKPAADRVPTLEAWVVEPADPIQQAQVHLYWRQYDGSMTEQRRQMMWDGEDWRLQLPNNPQTPELRAVEAPPENATAFDPPA
ncbi:hypothetical protein G6016_08840 [Dietzia aerolata]|uniref:DUF8175 domain-containing protein n=1 Tax=Dietzia aerolata TaxID=595984 RepID=A0ABV5JTD2_9ACTN|nr:hypothetical protein [Dietzia aerolata]MBB0969062.1 hypothetical protein [Dietzia aerolata]